VIEAGRRTAAQHSGDRAESVAARFLEAQGLRIVARNFRTRLGEIDLVAQDGDVLVFVEVRLRAHDRFGGAAASVGPGKQRRLIAAARGYLLRLGREPRCRFDVVALDAGEPQWLRGAFDAAW
jgi:putative endonuclease